jgi:hypothetical protein
MACGDANPADQNDVKRICEKCGAEMKQLGVLPAVSDRAALKVFRCYICSNVVTE